MLAVRLSQALEKRLGALASKTQRPKSFYVKEALQYYLDDCEKVLSAVADYEAQVKQGTLKTHSLEEIKERYGLD